MYEEWRAVRIKQKKRLARKEAKEIEREERKARAEAEFQTERDVAIEKQRVCEEEFQERYKIYLDERAKYDDDRVPDLDLRARKTTFKLYSSGFLKSTPAIDDIERSIEFVPITDQEGSVNLEATISLHGPDYRSLQLLAFYAPEFTEKWDHLLKIEVEGIGSVGDLLTRLEFINQNYLLLRVPTRYAFARIGKYDSRVKGASIEPKDAPAFVTFVGINEDCAQEMRRENGRRKRKAPDDKVEAGSSTKRARKADNEGTNGSPEPKTTAKKKSEPIPIKVQEKAMEDVVKKAGRQVVRICRAGEEPPALEVLSRPRCFRLFSAESAKHRPLYTDGPQRTLQMSPTAVGHRRVMLGEMNHVRGRLHLDPSDRLNSIDLKPLHNPESGDRMRERQWELREGTGLPGQIRVLFMDQNHLKVIVPNETAFWRYGQDIRIDRDYYGGVVITGELPPRSAPRNIEFFGVDEEYCQNMQQYCLAPSRKRLVDVNGIAV